MKPNKYEPKSKVTKRGGRARQERVRGREEEEKKVPVKKASKITVEALIPRNKLI